MKTSDFDYNLPPELIAQRPPPKREDARLLVIDRKTGKIEHRRFPEIIDYIGPGDLVLLNDVRVIPARLLGEKVPTGGKVEALLLREREPGLWSALIRPAKRTRPGTRIAFDSGLEAEVRERLGEGGVLIAFSGTDDLLGTIEEIGFPPLPPYIKRELKDYPAELRREDRERYQTVYAGKPGAVAAPTAGLHFTKPLLDEAAAKGAGVATLTLYVGYGTFRPVKTDLVEDHKMHAEYYEIAPETAEAVNRLKETGGKLWVVGTTTVRALESAVEEGGELAPVSASTDIFISPGYRFKLEFNLVTNFHLPRSTLLMLVSALAGREKILKAYGEAVREKYRFYSFGDAMLII